MQSCEARLKLVALADELLQVKTVAWFPNAVEYGLKCGLLMAYYFEGEVLERNHNTPIVREESDLIESIENNLSRGRQSDCVVAIDQLERLLNEREVDESEFDDKIRQKYGSVFPED